MPRNVEEGALVLADRVTAVAAWLAAVGALNDRGGHVYNLIYSISEPTRQTPKEASLVRSFNAFARQNGLLSTETVANTIFPLDTYRSQGPDLYGFYLDQVLPKVTKRWGTYFERMTRRRNDDGSFMVRDGVALNPLAVLIDKLRYRIEVRGSKTHYELSLAEPGFELPTYDPRRDGAYHVGGPCLSHLSFKLDAAGALRLTAFYRSHWYVSRALGNLIGLARLQTFVARSAGASVGALTVVASEAFLDVGGDGRPAAVTREVLRRLRADAGIP